MLDSRSGSSENVLGTLTNAPELPAWKVATKLLPFNLFAHVVSGLLLGAWLLYMLAPAGNPTGGDIFKAMLLAIGVTAAQMALSIMALNIVPSLRVSARRRVLPAIIGALLLIGTFAGWASASMIGLRTGQRAYFEHGIVEMRARVETDKDIVRRIDALIPIFHTCGIMAGDMLEREVGAGAISSQGRNAGPVSAELSSIRLSCINAEKALLSSRVLSSELFSDQDRVVAKARRVIDNPAIADNDKSMQLVRLSERLGGLHKELGQAVPADALRPIADSLNKDRAAIGLAPDAVATIAAALRPISKAIGQDLDEMIETLQVDFEPLQPVSNPMEFLAMFPAQMATAIGIAVLLELCPLIIILICLMAIEERRSDDDPRKNSDDRRVTHIDTARNV